MSSAISHMAERIGLGNQVSAHSFRKYFQTRMESAGVNPDWIDQIVGRKLMGVRGHNSLPKLRELFHVYRQGYDALRVNEEIATRADILYLQQENQELRKRLEEQEVATQRINEWMNREIFSRIGITGMREDADGIHFTGIEALSEDEHNNALRIIHEIEKDEQEK